MRFGVYLERHAVPEWASRYVDYRRCSRLLAAAVASHASHAAHASAPPSAAAGDDAALTAPVACAMAAGDIATLDQFLSALASECKATPEAIAYFSLLHAELIKVDTFFLRELAFFEAQFAQWRDQFGLLSASKAKLPESLYASRRERLRGSAIDLYHALSMLSNFGILNFTAFAKTMTACDIASQSAWAARRDRNTLPVNATASSSPAAGASSTSPASAGGGSVELAAAPSSAPASLPLSCYQSLRPLISAAHFHGKERLPRLVRAVEDAFAAEFYAASSAAPIGRVPQHAQAASASASASTSAATAAASYQMTETQLVVAAETGDIDVEFDGDGVVSVNGTEADADADDADATDATADLGATHAPHKLPAVAKELRASHPHVTLWTAFVIGLSIGLVVAALGVLGVLLTLDSSTARVPRFLAAFPVFRAVTIFAFAAWAWGAVVYVCQRARINFIFILDADPRTALLAPHIFLLAAALTLALLMSITLFTALLVYAPTARGFGFVHLALTLAFVALATLPTRAAFFGATRAFVWRTLWDNARAPAVPVEFHHFFIADFATSLVRPTSDLAYAVCFYASGDFLVDADSSCAARDAVVYVQYLCVLLPTLTRILQSSRRYRDLQQRMQLVNAGKFTLSFVSICVNFAASHQTGTAKDATITAWAVCVGVTSLFSFWYDLYVDWGFLRWNSRRFPLRETLVFPAWVYYAAAATNLALRFSWVVTISPVAFGLLDFPQPFFLLGTGMLEVVRRCVWALLRLEHEHLVNVENFRVVPTVPLLFEEGSLGRALTSASVTSAASAAAAVVAPLLRAKSSLRSRPPLSRAPTPRLTPSASRSGSLAPVAVLKKSPSSRLSQEAAAATLQLPSAQPSSPSSVSSLPSSLCVGDTSTAADPSAALLIDPADLAVGSSDFAALATSSSMPACHTAVDSGAADGLRNRRAHSRSMAIDALLGNALLEQNHDDDEDSDHGNQHDEALEDMVDHRSGAYGEGASDSD